MEDDEDDDDDDGKVEIDVTGDNAPPPALDDDDNVTSLSSPHVAQSKHCLHTRTRCKSCRHFSIVKSRDLCACDLMSTDTWVKFVDEIMAGTSDRSLN